MARDPLFILIVIALAVVVGILFTGIGGFVTGKNDGKKSNKLMQARVIAQFVAVAVIVLIVWLRSKG
ncbi:twin transmembrane helix small protein [Pseudooceanicola sp. 502str34]